MQYDFPIRSLKSKQNMPISPLIKPIRHLSFSIPEINRTHWNISYFIILSFWIVRPILIVSYHWIKFPSQISRVIYQPGSEGKFTVSHDSPNRTYCAEQSEDRGENINLVPQKIIGD